MVKPLPAQPSLEQLKKQAKDLRSQYRSEGELQQQQLARQRFVAHHPAWRGERPPPVEPALHDAQLVVAREYGFPTWPRLREEVERLALDFAERARRFVLDATTDTELRNLDGIRLSRARHALEREPTLAGASWWTQLVSGNVERIRAAVAGGGGRAKAGQAGGPRESWTPLLYISFSRMQMESDESLRRFAECGRVLLEAGADVHAVWNHPIWPDSPLSALYGATGENNNPHLARVLLEAGAKLDDGESIFHAAENYHLESLEVLREFGASLGVNATWGNTPLYFLLGHQPDGARWPVVAKGVRWLLEQGANPNDLCGKELRETSLHAAIRGGHSVETVRLLLDFGADPNMASSDGATPLALARRNCRGDLAELLVQRGATPVQLTPAQEFIAAVLSGDEATRMDVVRRHPHLREELNESEKLALVQAAERGDALGVRRLIAAGWDVAYKGDKEWGCTPLHAAAWRGWADAVDALLEAGAPVDMRANTPEDSFPLGWAGHGSGYHRNPAGDYPRIARALLAAGAVPHPAIAAMASPEVAEVIQAALAGGGEGDGEGGGEAELEG
ncbi:hypothetical protein DB346_23715 [Verrucomicrobia bacterium LW23]|nr:hypothetical protein DB346_23715 [Verrucomicrobia bacterium LW23]